MNEETARAGYQNQLDLIERMILQARNSYAESGHLYLIMGYAVLFCAVGQRLLQQFVPLPWSFSIWGLFIPLIGYVIWYTRKERKSQRVRSYTADVVGKLWLVFFIILFLTEVVLAANQQYKLIYPLVILLYGMPTWLVGYLLRFKPLQLGGVMCWILGLVCGVFFPGYSMWAISAAVISAWIIPGHILNGSEKKLSLTHG